MNYANAKLTSMFRKSFLTIWKFYDLFQNKLKSEAPAVSSPLLGLLKELAVALLLIKRSNGSSS